MIRLINSLPRFGYSLILVAYLLMTGCLLLTGCGANRQKDAAPETSGQMATSNAARTSEEDYGVYLSLEYDDLPKDISCKTLVIDAQYYSSEQIEKLHANNENIYSYINIGAIEEFRDYYKDYTDIFLGDYENWPDEKFIDVSQKKWQTFIVDSLAKDLADKGIDGYFLDNLDVYYEYQSEAIFDGLSTILRGLKDSGLSVVVNGGNVYVSEYLDRNKGLSDIIDAVNQEDVFTSINWKDKSFMASSDEDRQYYLDYLKRVSQAGCDVYLIEYTDDEELIKSIREECSTLCYTVYISPSLELN